MLMVISSICLLALLLTESKLSDIDLRIFNGFNGCLSHLYPLLSLTGSKWF